MWSRIFAWIMFIGVIWVVSCDKPLCAVVLTTSKDTKVFEKSMKSALRYLLDVDKFYVVTPDLKVMSTQFSHILGPRVVFVDEAIYPFRIHNVSKIMIETVRQKGVYPLSGDSSFERTVWLRSGWFLQQLLKLYAGRVLGLDDFLLLDSDLIWFRNVTFLNSTDNGGNKKYNYASSGQYNANYYSSLRKIGGVDMYEWPKDDVFRSGIVHHMVIVKRVLDSLMETSEKLHGGIPMWQVMLNQSALELTCRAPNAGVCGAGSTLSEYELYFNFALSRFRETIAFRPLLWANGPLPGYLFWPDWKRVPSQPLHSDKHKPNWLFYKNPWLMEAFERQILGDELSGYHYVGYHSYAKRRYYEMVERKSV